MPPSLLAALVLAQLGSSPVSPDIVTAIAASGRCAGLATSPDDRVSPPLSVAPGQPPLLSFRLYEGRLHHRDMDLDLMLDDAGH